MLLIILELASIAIWCIMTVQRMFNEILEGYGEFGDDRDILLGVMAILGGWLFAPYFAWLVYKWIRWKGEANENH